MNNLNEDNIINFLLSILEKEETISINEFKKAIREKFLLTEYDLTASPSRPNELRYEQRIRNIRATRNSPSNIKYENGIYTLIK